MNTSKINKSAASILESARGLFWKYGINKVTVEEICQAAGLSKMTFYRHFKNKEAVALGVLRKLVDKSREEYGAIMEQDIPFPDKVREMIAAKLKNTNNISREFITDVYGTGSDNALRQFMEKEREVALQLIVRDFKQAQRDGWIREDLKMGFVIMMLNDIHEKMMDERLAAMYDSTSDLIMELTRFFFYGISKNGKLS